MSKHRGLEGPFDRRPFDREIIILCVRRYLRYKLSLRDLTGMMAERGLSPLAHTTILRWVRRYMPEFVKRRNRFAMDRAGQTADFMLRAKLDEGAVKAFSGKAVRHQGQAPKTITPDGYAASHRAVRQMKADGLLPAHTKVRTSKYLGNLIEQDHRHVKARTSVMPGFKRFGSAAIAIAGIELMHRIRTVQFSLAGMHLKKTAAPAA